MSIFPITDLPSFLPVAPGKRTIQTLLDLPGQTKVVLAALDGGAEVPAHTVPYPAGVLVLSGALEVMREETWHPVKPGQYFSLPSGVRHAVRASEPSHFMVVHARGLEAV
jgi:quercetin dioxygenase-like cupin family protein